MRCLLVILCLATPALAEDEPPSLMERGAQMFIEGLLKEMEPTLDELQSLAGRAGPAMRDFLQSMGPKLGEILDQVEDWSVYHPPEILENGDIIIRRKADDSPPAQLGDGDEIEL